MTSGALTPREQGDLGELSAMTWLAERGAVVAKAVFHSPDWDLIADFSGTLVRVEVKTSTCRQKGRWVVMISTRGGNQSWSGVCKYFDAARCDYVFVHVADGRRWFIPAAELECRSGLTLGGPKYSAYEVEPGIPLAPPERKGLIESGASRGSARAVKGSRL